MLSSPSPTNASKRKAGDEMTSPPPVRRLRLSAPESSLPPDPPPTARKTTEPDSIHAILKDNYGIRLYVHPIAWCEKQLHFLGISFDRKFSKKEDPVHAEAQQANCHTEGACNTDSPAQVHAKELKLSRDICKAINRLSGNSGLYSKQWAMEHVLKAYNFHPFEKEYPFR
ncbi:hypothetical protein N7488_006446 [Penicillium malachiteum]|nr:hypothetical protein N7488_006446 [Penicillium malachiteum]